MCSYGHAAYDRSYYRVDKSLAVRSVYLFGGGATKIGEKRVPGPARISVAVIGDRTETRDRFVPNGRSDS